MEDDYEDLEKGPWFPLDMDTGQRMVVRNLVLAAKNGDEEAITEILKNGEVDINSKYKWETALMVAARKNNTNICGMLLEHGADCNISRLFQQTPLWIAAFHGNLEVMDLMLATNRCTQENIDNTFLRCVSMNFLDGCETLLNAGACVNAADNMGFKAIHRAAGTNETEAATKDMWRIINIETWRLHHSTNLELCELLLDWKADVNSLDPVQSTPLHHAAESGNEDVCRLLLEEGADVNAVGGIFRKTPLHVAVTNDYPQLVDILLLQKDIAPNIIDIDNDTPLMTAIKLHKKECVRVFLKQEDWYEYMSVSVLPKGEDRMIDTPMRLIIRHMPDVAMEVMNKSIELNSYKDAKHPDFTARFNFAFLDDAYTSKYWRVDGGNIATTSFVLRQVEGYEQSSDSSPRTNNAKGLCEKKKQLADGMEMLSRPNQDNGTADRRGPTKTAADLKKRRATLIDPWLTPSVSSRHTKEKSLLCDSRCFNCAAPNPLCKLKKNTEPYTERAATLKKNHPLMIAYQEKCTQVLCHPLAIALINHKWRKVGRFSFYGRLILRLIFVGLLTAQVLLSKDATTRAENVVTNATAAVNTQGDVNYTADLVSFVLLILACLQLAAEIFRMSTQFTSYFFILENYTQLFLNISSIVLVLEDGIFSQKLDQYPLASSCVFLGWFSIALILRNFPVIGIFFIMFTRILKNSITVLLIFFPILLGFAFSFSILLDKLPLFKKRYSLATVIVMLSGEVEYWDRLTKGSEVNNEDVVNMNTTIAAYVFFIVIAVICLLNLLVGLAVSDVDALHKESEGEMMTLKAEEVASCEFYMSKYFRRKITCGCLHYKPNKKRTCFPKAPGKPRFSIRKKITSWFNFLDFNDYRLSAANLLRLMRKEPKQSYDLLRREIAHLKNQIDVSNIPLSPRLSRCESRYSRKSQKLYPPPMQLH